MILAGDVLRVSARQKVDGVHDVVNVFHVIADTVVASDLSDVLDDLRTWVGLAYNEIATSLPDVVSSDILDVYNVSQDLPYGQVGWGGGYTGGTNSGDYTALGVSALLLFPTSAKRIQGRFYLGPLAEGHVSSGKVNSALLPNIANFAAQILDTSPMAEGSVFDYIVLSRADNTPHHPTTFKVMSELAYQRRRKRGRGS